jgi:hypothetical protein
VAGKPRPLPGRALKDGAERAAGLGGNARLAESFRRLRQPFSSAAVTGTTGSAQTAIASPYKLLPAATAGAW